MPEIILKHFEEICETKILILLLSFQARGAPNIPQHCKVFTIKMLFL
jgi:hypothetical protein